MTAPYRPVILTGTSLGSRGRVPLLKPCTHQPLLLRISISRRRAGDLLFKAVHTGQAGKLGESSATAQPPTHPAACTRAQSGQTSM